MRRFGREPQEPSIGPLCGDPVDGVGGVIGGRVVRARGGNAVHRFFPFEVAGAFAREKSRVMVPAADEIRVDCVRAQMPFAHLPVPNPELRIRTERLGNREIARRKIRIARIRNGAANARAKPIAPREDRRTRGRARWIRVRIAKKNAPLRQRIDVRCGRELRRGIGIPQR